MAIEDFFGSLLDPETPLGVIVRIAVVLVATAVVARLLRTAMDRGLRQRSIQLGLDETRYLVLRRIAVVGVYLVGAFVAATTIPGMEGLWVAVFASAGVVGIVVGFAAQKAVGNVITGVFLALFQPFRVGDTVTIKDTWGVVEDITFWHTTIRTFQDNARLVIPNSIIADEPITNHNLTDERRNVWIDIGIAYDADIDRARSIMLEEAKSHPYCMHGEGLEPQVKVIELGDFAVKLRLYSWAENPGKGYDMSCELRESIKKRFDAEGVEIPFPYRTIVFKRDLDGEHTQARNRTGTRRKR